MGRSVFLCLIVATGALLSTSVLAQGDSPGGRRIVGGVPTTIEKHPWQVALNIRTSDGNSFLCGGSVITQKWILTAAHCFAEPPCPGSIATKVAVSKNIRIKAGVTNFSFGPPWVEIERVVMHNEYSNDTCENDIALVKLKAPTSQRSIPLAGSATLLANTWLEVTGWGRTSEDGPFSRGLMLTEVPYVENEVCNQPASYDGSIKPTMMCAGMDEGGVDSCQGDSGGPLVLRGSNGSILVGVVSVGDGCARKLKYGVYTRVSEFRNWIANNLRGQ
jgi:secreted trypsin-like serine protease